MVFLPVVVATWTWHVLLRILQPWLITPKCWRILQHLLLFLLLVLILNLLYNVVVFKILFFLWSILKPVFTDSKTWFFNDQIRIFLFLLYHSCWDVVQVRVVETYTRHIVPILYSFSFTTWLKYWQCILFVFNSFWIIVSRSRSFLILKIFRTNFCWPELSSIPSLNFVNKLIFHRVSGLIGTRSWLFNFLLVYKFRETISLLYRYFFLFFLLKVALYGIGTRTNLLTVRWSSKPFGTHTKTRSWSHWFYLLNIWNFQVRPWSWGCLINVLILIIGVIINSSWGWNFVWKSPAIHLTIHWLIIFNYFFSLLFVPFIYDCAFSLVQCPHCFACESNRRFVIVEWWNIFSLIGAWAKIRTSIGFRIFYSFLLCIWPAWCPFGFVFPSHIVVSRSNFIFLLPFIDFDWRFIELKLVIYK